MIKCVYKNNNGYLDINTNEVYIQNFKYKNIEYAIQEVNKREKELQIFTETIDKLFSKCIE